MIIEKDGEEIYIPNNLKYTKHHVWVRLEGEEVRIGITDYLAKEKAITFSEPFLNLGDICHKDGIFNSFSTEYSGFLDLISPISGEIVELNDKLLGKYGDSLAKSFKRDPYEKAWLAVMKPFDKSELDTLLDAKLYADYIEFGEYEEKVLRFEEEARNYMRNREWEDLYICLFNLGSLCEKKGEKPRVLGYYFKALDQVLKAGEQEFLDKFMNYIFSIFKDYKLGGKEPCPCDSGLQFIKCHGKLVNFVFLERLLKVIYFDIYEKSVLKPIKRIRFQSEINALKELENKLRSSNKDFDGTIFSYSHVHRIEQGHVISLSLNYFKLKKIPEVLGELPYLRELTLSSNQIRNIENLVGLSELRILYLDNNQIYRIDGLEGLTQLRWLILHHNQIEKIEGLENLTQLTSLDLSHNQIKKLEGLETLTNLKYLKLNFNQIKKLEGFEGLTQLEEIWMNYNFLNLKDTEAIDKLPKLKKVSVFGNFQDSQNNGFTTV